MVDAGGRCVDIRTRGRGQRRQGNHQLSRQKPGLWGVKAQVASRGTTICRQNADLEASTHTARRHSERTFASGRGVLEIEARVWQYPNRIVGSTGWVRQVHNPQTCYRISVSAPRGISVFVGGRGFLKAHA
jgi:hypothetical protein